MFTSSLIISCNWKPKIRTSKKGEKSARRNQTNQRMINGQKENCQCQEHLEMPNFTQALATQPKQAKTHFFIIFKDVFSLVKQKYLVMWSTLSFFPALGELNWLLKLL